MEKLSNQLPVNVSRLHVLGVTALRRSRFEHDCIKPLEWDRVKAALNTKDKPARGGGVFPELSTVTGSPMLRAQSDAPIGGHKRRGEVTTATRSRVGYTLPFAQQLTASINYN